MSDTIKKQSTTKSIYSNLARGETTSDKLEIINLNSFYIDSLCTLIEGFDTTFSSEPTENATSLIQRLAREIAINAAGLHDTLRARGQS